MSSLYKKINKAGGITIPKELRRDYGFSQGEAVEVVPEGNKLVIRKYSPKCLLCNAYEEVIEHKGRHVCKKCIKEMSEQV